MPKAGMSEQQVTKETMEIHVESLRKQVEMNRLPMSKAMQLMIQWVTERQNEDHMVNPEFPKRHNPWVEQKKCSLL